MHLESSFGSFRVQLQVKQEMAYLARRIDEVGRYFLALESMLGSFGCRVAVLDMGI